MVDDSFRTRREILAMVTTSSVFALSGCSTGDNIDTTRESTTTTITGSSTQASHTTSSNEKPDTQTTPTHKKSRSPWNSSAPESWKELETTGTPAYTDDPNWRYVSHDTGNTFHNPHASGPKSDPNVRWTVDFGDGGYWDYHALYHPLIVDGTVYIAFAEKEGNNVSRSGLLAVDTTSGDTEIAIETSKYLWKPMIVNGTVYAALGGGIAAFDLSTGEKKWETDNLFRWPNSATYVNGMVVTGDERHIVAIDASTGTVQWSADLSNQLLDSQVVFPVVADQTVVHSGANPRELRTGKQRTTFPTRLSRPSLSDGTLFGHQLHESILSINWKTLEDNWVQTFDESEPFVVSTYVGCTSDVLITGKSTDPEETQIVGLDRHSGNQLWSTFIGEPDPALVLSDPTTAYLFGLSHRAIAIDPNTGTIQWEFQLPEDATFGYGAALANDLLVLADGSGKLWALE